MLQAIEGYTRMTQRADRSHKKTDAEHKAAMRADAFLGVWAEIDPQMPTSYVRMFIKVCPEPGKGVSKYCEDLDVYHAVGSRILLEIGPKSRHGTDGLGLVQSENDPHDLRQRRYYPTSKGWKLFARLQSALGIPEDPLED